MSGISAAILKLKTYVGDKKEQKGDEAQTGKCLVKAMQQKA